MRSPLFERFLNETSVRFTLEHSNKDARYPQYAFPKERNAVSVAYAVYLAGECGVPVLSATFPGETSSFIANMHSKAGPVVTLERVPFLLGTTESGSIFQRFLRWRMEYGL